MIIPEQGVSLPVSVGTGGGAQPGDFKWEVSGGLTRIAGEPQVEEANIWLKKRKLKMIRKHDSRRRADLIIGWTLEFKILPGLAS